MSGRLIILPKKSYAPWKPENVERVLRDERLERERLEREEAARLREESEARVEHLRKRKRSSSSRSTTGRGSPRDNGGGSGAFGADSVLPSGQHVNLFEEEEKRMADRAAAGDPVIVLPVPFGRNYSPGTSDRCVGRAMPCDLRQRCGSQTQTQQEGANAVELALTEQQRLKDDRIKAKMDPMAQFCSKAEAGLATNNNNSETSSRRGVNEAVRDNGSRKTSRDRSNGRNREKRRKRRRHRSDYNNSEHTSKCRKTIRSNSRGDDRRPNAKSSIKSKGGHQSDHEQNDSLSELRRRRQLREQKEAGRSLMIRLEEESKKLNLRK